MFVTFRKSAVAAIMLACMFGMSACEKTVDFSSDDAGEQTINEIKASLSPEKRKQFDEAIFVLLMADGDILADTEGTIQNGKDFLDGKTADEIIAAAAKHQDKLDAVNKFLEPD